MKGSAQVTEATKAAAATIAREEAPSILRGRWWQLSLGVVCMSMIANLQYGWTLFVNPIHDKHGWSVPAIQFGFSVFVVIETWLVPFEGYLVDKIGPKLVGVVAGIMVALAWVINSYADSLADALPRGGRRRHRRGSGVRRVRRERAQVVPGSARTCLRSHRDGFRRRFGADGLPDRQHDQVAGLRGDLLQVRHRTGRRRLFGELVSARPRLSGRGVAPRRDEHGKVPRLRSRVHAARNASHAGVLVALRDVRAHGDRRAHFDGATDAYREGFFGRRGAGRSPRHHARRASVRAGDEPRAQRRQPALLRMDVRPPGT